MNSRAKSQAITERRQRAAARPAVAPDDAQLITRFIESIWAEHGLARSSLESYRRDLEGLSRWRDAGAMLAKADRAVLFDYLAFRTQQQYSPRSNARLLTTLRSFYGWLIRQNLRTDDPTALL